MRCLIALRLALTKFMLPLRRLLRWRLKLAINWLKLLINLRLLAVKILRPLRFRLLLRLTQFRLFLIF
jgi:hypothetical protein